MKMWKTLIVFLLLLLCGCENIMELWGYPHVAENPSLFEETYECEEDADCPDDTAWERFSCSQEGQCIRTLPLCDAQLVLHELEQEPVNHAHVVTTAGLSALGSCPAGSLCIPLWNQNRHEHDEGICVPSCPQVNWDHSYPFEMIRRVAMVLTFGRLPIPHLYDSPDSLWADLGGYPQAVMDHFINHCGVPRCAFSSAYVPGRCPQGKLVCPADATQFQCDP